MADEIIGRISVGDGATFTPSVSSAGELSWTNNKNLPNPATVDIAQAVVNSGSLDSRYLKLSGGTMTGSIYFTGLNSHVSTAGGGGGTFDLGWDYENRTGALIGLRSVDWSTEADRGSFHIFARDATNNHELIGKTDGTLTWSGNNIITSAGGTMTGTIVTTAHPAIRHSNNNNTITFVGGAGTGGGDGAKIILVGGSASSDTGNFTIQAGGVFGSTTKYSALVGKPDGTLTWGGKAVIVGTEYSQQFTLTTRLNANASADFTLTAQPKYWSVVCVSGSGWGGLMFNVSGAKVLRVTNKNTSALTENIVLKINYIA